MAQERVIEDFRSELLGWASDNLRTFRWRETTDPYEILIAEILLQKTAAEKVEPVYEEFLATYPTLEELAAAERNELADIIYSLGLQNQRSKALVSIGQALRSSGVPDDAERLLELPYVGRYAANATLCFAFGEPRPIVDANVVRVYNRIFDTDFDYRDEEAWQFAEEVLPEADAWEFNLAILDFAAEICAPKTPNCEECFFTDRCGYYRLLR
jgi:A/G-specific adenine glycosylase